MPERPPSALERLRQLEPSQGSRASRPPPGGSPHRGRRAGAGGVVVAVLLAVLLKGKWLLLFLATKGKLLLGALKIGPMLTTLSTMAASAWVYATFYGAELAIGLVVLILVHEYGHGVAARLCGLRVGAPVFIPLFGAVIALKDQPRTTWVESVVGFGGPFAGLLGSLLCLAIAAFEPDGESAGLLIVLAWLNATINFLNLMPVFGLDGDRISQPFRPWYWIPGSLFTLLLIAWSIEVMGTANPFLFFILILGAIKGVRAWFSARRVQASEPEPRAVDRISGRAPKAPRYQDEASVAGWQRRASAWMYFALAGLLCATMLTAWSRLPAVG